MVERLRYAQGLTQEDLADKVDIDPTTIDRIEDYEPCFPSKLNKIAQWFQNVGMKVELQDLIAGSSEVSQHPVSETKITDTLAEASYLTELVMTLTDEPRLNLTKSFDYFDAEHFRAHVSCILNGVSYRWLAYETEKIDDHWHWYTEELLNRLRRHHVALQQQLRKSRMSDQDIQDFLGSRVQCHVFPTRVQCSGQVIPFRIVIFGKSICLCTEEPGPRTYHQGHTFLVPPPFLQLRRYLYALYRMCPAISERYGIPNSAKTNERLHACHRSLRSALLKALVTTGRFSK